MEGGISLAFPESVRAGLNQDDTNEFITTFSPSIEVYQEDWTATEEV